MRENEPVCPFLPSWHISAAGLMGLVVDNHRGVNTGPFLNKDIKNQ